MTADALRDRLRSRKADSSLINTSHNTSAFEDKQSPVCKSRYVNDNQRLEAIRVRQLENRIKWHSGVMTLFVLDYFVMGSRITAFLLLFGFFSPNVNSCVASTISVYSMLIILSAWFEIKFPNLLQKLWQSHSKPVPVAPRVTPSPGPRLDTSAHSHTSDISWVDAHKFGTPSQKPLHLSPPSHSPGYHHHTSTSDTSGILDDSGWKSPAAYGKLIDSIHTRKQLDVLLRSNRNDAPIDMSASQSYLSSIWSVFDLGGRRGAGQMGSGYQISEEIQEEVNPNASYRMRIGKNGRTEVKMVRKGKDGEPEDEDEDELVRIHKIMNAAKNSQDSTKTGILKRSNSVDRAGIRGRRRSHSSPDRTTSTDQEIRYRTGELLSEEQQKRAELLTRVWIRNTIVEPLVEHIDDVNRILEKEHANPPLQIGTSSVDALKLAAMERDALKSSNLPFLLPFLNVTSNQAYLVSRLKELNASQFMDAYKWNAGGAEPATDMGPTTRLVRREWSDSLPTDAVLIFDLFLAYMDAQLNSNCLVGDNRLDQPFTSRFCVKSPRKPTAAQRAPFSFYLHLVTVSPPHVEFVYIDENGSPCKCNVLRQNPNVFRAVAQFVHFVKEENHGFLDQTAIGPTGINLTKILN